MVHGSNDYQEPSPRNPLRYFTGPSANVPDYKHLDVDALDRFFTDDLGWSILDDTAVSVDVKGLRVSAFGSTTHTATGTSPSSSPRSCRPWMPPI